MSVAEALVVFVLGACAGTTIAVVAGFVVVERTAERILDRHAWQRMQRKAAAAAEEGRAREQGPQEPLADGTARVAPEHPLAKRGAVQEAASRARVGRAILQRRVDRR